MIKHNKPTIGSEEKKAIDRVIRSRFLSSDIEVKKFENEMSNYLKLGDDNAVALSNGTSALFILVNLLNKKKGCNNTFILMLITFTCYKIKWFKCKNLRC